MQKTAKKFLSMLLALMMVLSILPTAVFATEQGTVAAPLDSIVPYGANDQTTGTATISGGVTQNRAVQRLSNAVDSRRVGQRITVSIGKHISQIQRPRITKCYIGCGDCIGSDRRGRVAFIGEGE